MLMHNSVGKSGTQIMAWIIIQATINGILNGGIYALVAVGLTIVFGVMKMVNFATGEFIMWGMYFTFLLYTITGLNNYVLLPMVIILTILLGLLSYVLVIKPVLGRDSNTFIMVTVGLSYLLMNVAQMIFGPTPKGIPSEIKTASLSIGTFTVSLPRLIAFLSACLLIIAIQILLKKTMLGRAMRATAENAEMAQVLGINYKQVYTFAFVLSCVMAGVAGTLITPIYSIYPSLGNIFKIIVFVVVVLGGMGSVSGALIGGLLLGIMEALVGTLINSNLGPAGIFVVFLLMLYLRPNGLFGTANRVA